MGELKKCIICGKDIINTKRSKYCDEGCSIVAYHARHLVTTYKKPCICGCGGFIVSRKENIEKDYIVGHDKKINPENRCQLCGNDSEELIVYEMTNCDIKICLECNENIRKEKE